MSNSYMARGQFAFFWIFQKKGIDNISSKSQKRQRLVAFILFNTIQYNTHALWRTTSMFKQTGPTTIFLFRYQSCVWPRSDPFFRHNSCSGCNSGIDLVVCSWIYFLSTLLHCWTKLRRSYVKYPAVVLTSHTS